jgi:peptide chain release factor 3
VLLEFEPSPYEVARWVGSDDPALLKKLLETLRSNVADDQDNLPVLLMRNAWEFGRFQQEWPGINFNAVRERS